MHGYIGTSVIHPELDPLEFAFTCKAIASGLAFPFAHYSMPTLSTAACTSRVNKLNQPLFAAKETPWHVSTAS